MYIYIYIHFYIMAEEMNTFVFENGTPDFGLFKVNERKLKICLSNRFVSKQFIQWLGFKIETGGSPPKRGSCPVVSPNNTNPSLLTTQCVCVCARFGGCLFRLVSRKPKRTRPWVCLS